MATLADRTAACPTPPLLLLLVSHRCQDWDVKEAMSAVRSDTKKKDMAKVLQSTRKHEATRPKRCAEGAVAVFPHTQLTRLIRTSFGETGRRLKDCVDTPHYDEHMEIANNKDICREFGTSTAAVVAEREHFEAVLRDRMQSFNMATAECPYPAIPRASCNVDLVRWYASIGCDLHRVIPRTVRPESETSSLREDALPPCAT